MTTYFPFTPSGVQAPSFQPTLDGQVCTCTIKWNLFGQRYYVQCVDQDDDLVFNVALIESPPAMQLEALSWDAASLTAAATTTEPHGYALGSTINLTLSGASPSGYDGEYDMWATGDDDLMFSLSYNPGQATLFGSVSRLVSMSAGYFSSTLVYRSGQFEVSP
jgi:hypothetical protein